MNNYSSEVHIIHTLKYQQTPVYEKGCKKGVVSQK